MEREVWILKMNRYKIFGICVGFVIIVLLLSWGIASIIANVTRTGNSFPDFFNAWDIFTWVFGVAMVTCTLLVSFGFVFTRAKRKLETMWGLLYTFPVVLVLDGFYLNIFFIDIF